MTHQVSSWCKGRHVSLFHRQRHNSCSSTVLNTEAPGSRKICPQSMLMQDSQSHTIVNSCCNAGQSLNRKNPAGHPRLQVLLHPSIFSEAVLSGSLFFLPAACLHKHTQAGRCTRIRFMPHTRHSLHPILTACHSAASAKHTHTANTWIARLAAVQAAQDASRCSRHMCGATVKTCKVPQTNTATKVCTSPSRSVSFRSPSQCCKQY